MTLNEAKAVIYGNVVYACEKAGLAPQTTQLVQDACDTVIALADRKTENSSEKPNNCETCKFELYCPEMCEGCCEWDSHYEPKDEPTVSKMEQVQTIDGNSYTRGFADGQEAMRKLFEKTEPQMERSEK